MRTTNSSRLPIGDFYTQHLATPTAGAGSAARIALVRMRRVQQPNGAWGWARGSMPGQNRRSAQVRQLR